MLRHRWLKFAALLAVPLILAVAVAKRASWRPRTFHYADTTVAVAYSPDGHWLACVSESKLELRDAQTEQVVWSEALGDDAGRAVAFSPDNNTLAVGRNNSLQLWDVTTHRLQHDLLAHYPYWYNTRTLLFIPHSTQLITGGDQSPVLLWDTQSGKLLRTITKEKTFIPLTLAPDGKTLALSNAHSYATLLDLDTGTQQKEIRLGENNHEASVNCATFAPDQQTLAVGTDDGKILLWDIATGHETRQFVAHPTRVNHLTFSLDGKLLATSGYDETVKLWDAPQGKLLRTLTQHKGSINGLSFAPDGATLAVACGDTIQLWRVK